VLTCFTTFPISKTKRCGTFVTFRGFRQFVLTNDRIMICLENGRNACHVFP
jgi:hypothetical protein